MGTLHSNLLKHPVSLPQLKAMAQVKIKGLLTHIKVHLSKKKKIQRTPVFSLDASYKTPPWWTRKLSSLQLWSVYAQHSWMSLSNNYISDIIFLLARRETSKAHIITKPWCYSRISPGWGKVKFPANLRGFSRRNWGHLACLYTYNFQPNVTSKLWGICSNTAD